MQWSHTVVKLEGKASEQKVKAEVHGAGSHYLHQEQDKTLTVKA